MNHEGLAELRHTIPTNWTTDFYFRLANAVKLKEFSIECGCIVPLEAIETINSLAWRTGLVQFLGQSILPEEPIFISDQDVSALDSAIVQLNAATCPTTLSLLSASPKPVLTALLQRARPMDLDLLRQEQSQERFWWASALIVVLDVDAFWRMETWSAPLVIAVFEALVLIALRPPALSPHFNRVLEKLKNIISQTVP